MQGLFKCFVQEKVNYVSSVCYLTKKMMTSELHPDQLNRNLAGLPDFQDWWSDGPLPRNVHF